MLNLVDISDVMIYTNNWGVFTMVTMEEAGIILDEIAGELPIEFYNKLNGGILLLPQAKLHPEHKGNDLYILGQYCYSNTMGRYITIYYGSFEKLYGHLEPKQFKEELRRTLIHEFTHHVESLAGDKSLEIKDKKRMSEYRKNKEWDTKKGVKWKKNY